MVDHAEEWKDEALCKDLPINTFFPEEVNTTTSVGYLLSVQNLRDKYCWKCPVRVRCFEYALEDDNSLHNGVWGGSTPADRQSFIVIKCRCGSTLDPKVLIEHGPLTCKACRKKVQ